MESVKIRMATATDCEELERLIKELATYEKLSHQCKITAAQLAEDGFGDVPYYRCLVAEPSSIGDDESKLLVGYALFFNKYSTFEGRSLYLEDIYVSPEYRHRKIGSRMLKRLGQIAVDEGCFRIDFTVLSWNTNSIDFYKKLGAVNLTETEQWHLFRFYAAEYKSLADMNIN